MAKSKSKSKKKASRGRVKLIPPSSREARDEGPRLIPLGPVQEEPRVQRYLELADAALTGARKSGKRGARRGPSPVSGE